MNGIRTEQYGIRRRRFGGTRDTFAEVVRDSSEIDNLGVVWDRITAIVGRARRFDHLDVRFGNTATRSRSPSV